MQPIRSLLSLCVVAALFCAPATVHSQEPQKKPAAEPAPPAAPVEPAQPVPDGADEKKSTPDQWIRLFNGVDLDGWTPKIRGYELGENFADTFRVRDGAIAVAYDGYDKFGDRFGHLYFKEKFSHYRLRIEYRFTGEQVAGGPGWAWRNSGVMLHGEDPAGMTVDQEFPVSIEVQFLGGDGNNPRPTLNLCTPGTNVFFEDQLYTAHCRDSNSQTYAGDQWVTANIEVRGNQRIRHYAGDQLVLEYTQPQLDARDSNAQRLIVDDLIQLEGGTISLQSESHPVEFRAVEIQLVDPQSPLSDWSPESSPGIKD